MSPKWKLLVALAGLAVVVAAGLVVLWPRGDRVTRYYYDRIQIGMNRADVEAILGPPGDYRTGLGERGEIMSNLVWFPDPAYVDDMSQNWDRLPTPIPSGLWASWSSDSLSTWITIDDSGRVVHKEASPRRMTQGQFDSFVWRAKRSWHRWFP
jgi:hypothetical protein